MIDRDEDRQTDIKRNSELEKRGKTKIHIVLHNSREMFCDIINKKIRKLYLY